MYQQIIQFLKREPLKFVLIVFSLLVLKELVYINTFRDDVSPIADGFSEANTIRGATFFYEKGLGFYKGLPDIGYSEQLTHRGGRGFGGSHVPEAYTHYPPGPEYMAWLGFQIFGNRNFNAIRLLPITLSILAGIFFIRTIFHAVGGGLGGGILGLLLILPPMYSNFMHGLHHQQYAFLMLQTQISLCILFFTNSEWKRWYVLLFLFLLGFCQGWMTFDYAFLATLFSIPFYFYYRKTHSVSFLSFVMVGLASGLSFTLAHILHFYEVVAYYGSFDRALADFVGSAKYRAVNDDSTHVALVKYDPKKIGPITVAKDFLYRVAGRGKYLAINLINFVWIIVGLKFIKKISFKKGWTFEFSVTGNDLLALFAAVVVSSGWSLVMKQHAHIHGFVARHYYLAYFFCCLILIERTKKVPEES